MKKLITPLGALISLIFIPSTWVYINQATRSYSSQKFPVGLYEMYRAVPSLGFVILGLVLVALVLITVPFFLRNPLRKTLIVGLSVVSLLLLLAFLTFKSELSRGGDIVELGKGWFGSFFGFVIAFAGAFIKTRPAKTGDGLDLPVKGALPMISAVIVLICLPASILAYLFLTPPAGSFPMSVDGLSRTTRVEYRKDENFPGVYGATYGMSIFHTIQKKNSAEEAKEDVRKFRESVKKDAERAFSRWKNQNKLEAESEEAEKFYQKDNDAVFIAREDKPEDDYFVYVSGSRATIAWASGNWFCTVIAPKAETELSEVSAARFAFDFARSLPYPPRNTTAAPAGEYQAPFSMYVFVREDFPLWFSEKALIYVPLIIAAPFMLLILLRFGKRKRV